MQTTNDFEQQAKLAALDAAIKIQSMYPNMPLVIDLKAIPNIDPEMNVAKWHELTKESGIAYVTNVDANLKIIDISDTVITRASKLYEWLTEKK